MPTLSTAASKVSEHNDAASSASSNSLRASWYLPCACIKFVDIRKSEWLLRSARHNLLQVLRSLNTAGPSTAR